MKREARVGLGILLGAVVLSALLIGMALKQQPVKPVVIPEEGPGRAAPAGGTGTGSALPPGRGMSPEGIPDVPAAGSEPGTLATGPRRGNGGSETFGLSGNVPVAGESGGAAPDAAEDVPRPGGTDTAAQSPSAGAGQTDSARPRPGGSQESRPGRGQGSASATPDRPAAGGDLTYTVEPGDNPWKIAERFYGSGTQWKRIADANPGLKSDSLKVGTKLVIPGKAGTGTTAPAPRSGAAPPAGRAIPPAAEGPESAGKAAAGTPRVHRVAEGDSLYRLAEKYLGSGSRYEEIKKLNPGIDPLNLKLGQEIKIPPR